MRRWSAYGGAALAVAGFTLALVSLALPWARYRVSAQLPGQTEEVTRSGGIAVFQLDWGIWYVLILLTLLGLLAGAATTRGRAARIMGVSGVLLAVVGMLLTNAVANGVSAASLSSVVGVLGTVDLRTDGGPGTGYGLVALPLLGLGVAMLSVRHPAE